MTPPIPSKANFKLVGMWLSLSVFAACVGDESDPSQPDAGGAAGAGGTSNTGGASGAGASGTSGSTVAAPVCIPPSTGGATGTIDAGSGPGASAALDGGGIDSGGVADPFVRLEGRIEYSDPTKPGFAWSGSAIFARFQGTGATVHLDGAVNQFAVVVDGTVASQVLKTVTGTFDYTVASGLAPGVHDLVVWRRTEGNQGRNRFLSLDVEGGQLQAPPLRGEHRIEIYGDSITAGYGVDGQGPSCPWSPDTENHYLTYGAVTARELDAELHTVAVSGIGMYRNYNKTDASPDAMPSVYARILTQTAASVWDFSTWQPHAVVINLGTNDASTLGDPGMGYRTAYLDFVRNLRQKYPNTFFVLTIGPMLDGANLSAIKGHLLAVIDIRKCEGDAKLSFLEFPVQSASDGYGCDWHPSPRTNAKMATLLVAELKTRLGW
jgi:hypothetical protein